MTDRNNFHVPVLINSLVEFLNLPEKQNFWVFDGTLGGGGYTSKFLDLGMKVTACDLDQKAIEFFQKTNQQEEGNKLELKHGNFAQIIDEFDPNSLDLAVLDLGYSSNQLEDSGRGFSYLKYDQILDLRYDTSQGALCVEKIYALPSVNRLWGIIYRYSGEKFAKPLARGLFDFIHRRSKEDILTITVGEVVEVLENNIPSREKHRKNSILSRVWQSLRIWTNNEFASLEEFLDTVPAKLKQGGFLAIICFHSLEDKIVTQRMRELSKPFETDSYGNKSLNYKLLTPKPITPGEKEIQDNKRSRSATLRVLQKLGEF
jgi:16S rRNA (cytosine1402-N4)-methyltransferase